MKELRNKLIAGALFGLLVLIVLLMYTDLRAVGTHLQRFPLALIIPILGLTLFNYALRRAPVRSMKWQVVDISSLSSREYT